MYTPEVISRQVSASHVSLSPAFHHASVSPLWMSATEEFCDEAAARILVSCCFTHSSSVSREAAGASSPASATFAADTCTSTSGASGKGSCCASDFGLHRRVSVLPRADVLRRFDDGACLYTS